MPKIDVLFKIMLEKGNSDLHLSPDNHPMIKVHRELETIEMRQLTHNINRALLCEI